eukprot:g20379.t1
MSSAEAKNEPEVILALKKTSSDDLKGVPRPSGSGVGYIEGLDGNELSSSKGLRSTFCSSKRILFVAAPFIVFLTLALGASLGYHFGKDHGENVAAEVYAAAKKAKSKSVPDSYPQGVCPNGGGACSNEGEKKGRFVFAGGITVEIGPGLSNDQVVPQQYTGFGFPNRLVHLSCSDKGFDTTGYTAKGELYWPQVGDNLGRILGYEIQKCKDGQIKCCAGGVTTTVSPSPTCSCQCPQPSPSTLPSPSSSADSGSA